MTISLTTLTGPIYMPNGATPVGGTVIFELSSWDKQEGEAVFVSGPYCATIDENGEFLAQLFTTSEGSNNVNYKMSVSYQDKDGNQKVEYIGIFALAGEGPFKISDISITSEVDICRIGSFDVLAEIKAYANQVSTNVAGIKGDKGDKGDNGVSAYDLAVLAGFTGTEEQWLQSLGGTIVISEEDDIDLIAPVLNQRIIRLYGDGSSEEFVDETLSLRTQIRLRTASALITDAKKTLVVILNTGQSLSLDRKQGTASTILTPAKGLQPNGGSQSGDIDNLTNIVNKPPYNNFQSLIPFVQEQGGEGWGVGSIIQHAKSTTVDKVAFYSSAVGARDAEQVGHGSGPWGASLNFLQLCYNYAKQNGLDIRLNVRSSLGEADSDTTAAGAGTSEAPITQAQRELVVKNFVQNMSNDWNTICNGEFAAPIFTITTLNSSGNYGIGGIATNAADLKVAQEGIVTLLPARYLFADNWESDLVHPDPIQYRLYAELASLIEIGLTRGQTFIPLHVTQHTVVNPTTIQLTLSENSEIDEVDVTNPEVIYADGKRGIHLHAADGTEKVVTSSELIDPRTIEVTLASPMVAGDTLRIAQQNFGQALRSLTWLPRANFRATKTLGQSDLLINDKPFIFRNYIIQQEVSL